MGFSICKFCIFALQKFCKNVENGLTDSEKLLLFTPDSESLK